MQEDDELALAATALGTTGSSSPRNTTEPQDLPSFVSARYEIVGLLGAGGMGRVYRARDTLLDELVALKLLRGELLAVAGALERFRQEVKLARRVTHANVVRTFDLGQHGTDYYLTMELVDGPSLARLLDAGPLAVPELVRIAGEIARGVAAAHGKGVVHRDLKPDNVLVAKAGRVAISDFGIACASEAATSTERFVGTPAYMAPEQVEPGHTIGPAADVYAFGVMLYEMLTGRRPFDGTDAVEVATARLREAPPDARALRSVPATLAVLAQRCMARDPRDRPSDGVALAAEVERLDATATAAGTRPFSAIVPFATSRAVAILPLRASAELAELADGLSEEIVDMLSMTRELRVRPLASVRRATGSADDPRELGRRLGVDVVVDGSVRQRGDLVRIAAHAIGVADGFQLWASHFDAAPGTLLAASDDVVRAIARALTVDLELPARVASNPDATALCLQSKAKLRARWLDNTHDDILADLERALLLAPDDPAIQAVLATALARAAFYGAPASALVRARDLATRAVANAPRSGDPWFALAVTSVYAGEHAEAGRALRRAIDVAPGFATAQAMLGGLLLEAGALGPAIAHLEAANQLDPHGPAHIDLPRAYVYAGRWADAEREFEAARIDPTFANGLFDAISRARFALWRGEVEPLALDIPPEAPTNVAAYAQIVQRIHTGREVTAADRERLREIVAVANPRLRASRSQFAAEYLLFAGSPDEAMRYVDLGVEAGLQDITWIERCPLLEPLRARADFAAQAARVADRARGVVAAIELD